MGTNPVTSPITNETLRQRALELKTAYSTIGTDFSTPVTHKDTNGALFTFKKDATTGEVTCTYTYHNEKPRDILLFERATVATSKAGLTHLNEQQLAEYNINHPNSYTATEYTAANEAVAEKARLEKQLNHYDKDTRNNAREQYEDLVAEQLFLSGTVDKNTAKKMAKYARKDAQAGQRAEHTTVYLDKKEYENAKKRLKAEQKAAERQIEAAYERGFMPNKAALAKMEEQVQYIDDNDVRKYINSHKQLFFDANGKFSSDMYQNWIKGHLQGDNTLTTGERAPASTVTGLSKTDMKHAARDGGYDTQNDYTLVINLAKTAAAIAAPVILAYMTNHNIHEVSQLKDVIEAYANDPDPSNYNEFISAISKAESISEVTANFRNVAVRNAFFGALGPIIANLWNPEAQRDKVSDAITASTITTQNIFRGTDVTHVEGQVVVEEETTADKCYQIDGTPGTEGKEATPDENVFNLEMNKKGNVIFWYQTADAYPLPEGLTKKDIYNAVRKANGDPDCNKYPPNIVGLPEYLEITKNGKTYKVNRLDKFSIKGKEYKATGKGNLKTGTTYQGRKGSAAVAGTPGNYKVKDCETGKVLKGDFKTELEAQEWIESQKRK